MTFDLKAFYTLAIKNNKLEEAQELVVKKYYGETEAVRNEAEEWMERLWNKWTLSNTPHPELEFSAFCKACGTPLNGQQTRSVELEDGTDKVVAEDLCPKCIRKSQEEFHYNDLTADVVDNSYPLGNGNYRTKPKAVE